ncbi:MAG: hypothetical protein RLZ98_1421 [Pseudomonadota bacterium]
MKDKIQAFIADEELQLKNLGDFGTAIQFPLKEVAILARACYGGVIMGFRQTYAPKIIEKHGTPHQKPERAEAYFPTPWNQLEAGMLFALRRPIIVFAEDGIEGGIFDKGSSDLYLNVLPKAADFDDVQVSVRQIIRQWASEVRTEYRRWG